MNMVLFVASLLPLCIFFYFIYRYIVGYGISRCMKAFDVSYDSCINKGSSKKDAFLESLPIFKKCRPFNRLSEGDWRSIENTFTQLDNPKKEFLKLMLRPSSQLMNCFIQPSFFEEFLRIKNKYKAL